MSNEKTEKELELESGTASLLLLEKLVGTADEILGKNGMDKMNDREQIIAAAVATSLVKYTLRKTDYKGVEND